MVRINFPNEVAERLKFYVYRLIDPRDGQTFYVGKGKRNRIFQHATGALKKKSGDEDAADLKLQRIKEITSAGLQVAHVIHRHGIEDEKIAFQIEAAVMDAYPGLTNRVSGHGASDYGVRHVEEVIAEYSASPFEVQEPLILINITTSYSDETRNIYDSVRGCWRIDRNKAEAYRLVLAQRRGLVVGAFRPTRWVPATPAYFPWLDEDFPLRSGFEGEQAEIRIANLYVNRRVPEEYRARGAANPIRFITPAN
ncbi:MAG TPA: hypothetical protein VIJ42_13300 [Stellaceae bacterium]